jgi:hypothetical protein
VRFAIEICRNGYRYFYKYYGRKGAQQYRRVVLIKFRIRQAWYGLVNLVRPDDVGKGRLEMYRATVRWNKHLDPIRFVEQGIEQ